MSKLSKATVSVLILALYAGLLRAEDLQPEIASVERLGNPTPHWLVINDPNFLGYLDSKVYLVDADSSIMLGMLSTGAWHSATEFSPAFDMLYSPETYYSRGNEGERTDVLRFYDRTTLSTQGEVIIPPKRGAGAPHRAYSGRSDDGRFVYVVNMTPASSVSVVDVERRVVTQEIATPGCAMVYPSGNRSFLSLCGNGSIQHTVMNAEGTSADKSKTKVFFDPTTDPLTEKAGRVGDVWYFISFSGEVVEVRATDRRVRLGKSWPIMSEQEFAQGWRPGGGQLMAVHPSAGLFVAMNSQGDHSHKVSGEAIWQFDLRKRKRLRVIEVEEPVKHLATSADAAPLLAASTDGPEIYIFDALSGAARDSLEAPLLGAGILQFVQLPTTQSP